MGHRGRRAEGRQQVDRPSGPQARSVATLKRRATPPWIWCGVVFLAASTACGVSGTPIPPSRNVLTIGVPEGSAPGTGTGLGQLTNTLTLEGLTQTSTSTDGRALPRLAESWTWENGGRRLRLRLRSGVTFHDGTPLTSAVAADALKRAIARGANRALYPSVADITSIQSEDDLVLVLELS